jgi:putative lipoprotein
MIRIAVAMAVAALLAACASTADVSPLPGSPGSPASLAGTTWRAVSVAGAAPVAGHEPTLAFADDKVSGSTGCNQYFGGYTSADGTIALTGVGMTLMGCDNAIGAIEAKYTQALSAATSVAIDDGGQLLLSGPGGDLLFRPDAAGGS